MLLWILSLSSSVYCQSYGLLFSSHEVVPEKRTCLNLTSAEPLYLKENTKIVFDLKFAPNLVDYFGYLVRIITSNDQNIDITYNPNSKKFAFVIEDSFSNNFTIDYTKLFGEWTNFEIQFNSTSQEALLYIDKKLICKGPLKFSDTTFCQIYFGVNSVKKFETIDVPPMKLKDIRIFEGNTQKYFYPLSQTSGNQALDVISKNVALVNNPGWMASHHQNWKLVDSLVTKSNPSIAFDKKSEVLYIVSVDSVYQFSFKRNQLSAIKLAKDMVNLHAGNQSVFDESSAKLYNFFIDTKKVSTYDEVTSTWTDGALDFKLTAFWQANKFISSVDSTLYILGGYGYHQYKNQVQRYQFANKNWEILESNGDFFMPRYLAALGTNSRTDTAFIIGGYGSKSGDQTRNPKYNYELMAYSVRNHSFKHVYNFKQPENEFGFSNSLIIDSASNQFYGLIYPIDRYKSFLQLVKGSLSSPEYELLGDRIPYLFHDIESFSDLFYCRTSQKLVAVTILSPKNKPATVKIFTIDFPPNELLTTQSESFLSTKKYWLFVISLVLVCTTTIYLAMKRRRKRKPKPMASSSDLIAKNQPMIESAERREIVFNETLYEARSIKSSIFLFSHFEVVDKQGNEITRLFTPLLKEMFLLILIHTMKDNKGISSDELYETLWADKPIKDARNNFSVNIVKLKSILEKVGETIISKETGKWRFEIVNNSIYLDYQQFIHLVNDKQKVVDRNCINELLSIINKNAFFLNKGAFLSEVHYTWIDDFKEKVGGFIVSTISSYLSNANLKTEPEFILRLTNCIFHFDPMSEEALSFKCKSLITSGKQAMAKETYLTFCKEYQKNYGEETDRHQLVASQRYF